MLLERRDLLGSGIIPVSGGAGQRNPRIERGSAFLAVVTRQLVWGQRVASRELEGWRRRAQLIPDPALRKDAIESVEHKSDHAHGAALFSVLARRRDVRLLRLLVAYQTLWDYLDNVSERYPSQGEPDELHRALVAALDPNALHVDCRESRTFRDAGYVRALVTSCQDSCSRLPSYPLVRPLLLDGAARCAVQALNHDPVHHRREAALKRLAGQTLEEGSLEWFELTAAASAYLPHPLLALACDSELRGSTVLRTDAAYYPWVSLAIAMLDSYVDQGEDRSEGKHSYIAYYGSEATAVTRVCEVIRRAISEVRGLPGGDRHVVLVAAMVAMYLSKTDTRNQQATASVRQLLNAGGPVSRMLVSQLRAWRLLRRVPRATGTDMRQRLPPGLPLPAPLQTLLFWKSPFTYLESCQRRYGRRFTLRATGHPPLVFLSDPAEIKAVFAARADVLHPGAGSEVIRPLVGAGSFMIREENEHLITRRAILPSLHAKVVHEHTRLVAEIAAREVSAWPRDVSVALHPRLRAMTLQIILHTALGPSATRDPARTLALRDQLLAMFEVTATPALAEPLSRAGPGRAAWQRFLRERAAVDEVIHTLIDERRGDATDTSDVLARLLAVRRDGTPMTSDWVRDNLISIILAGHETTAAELAWAFQLLAHNPHKLNRLVSEIDHGTSDVYLMATVQEVLRHRPVFLFAIPRTVAQPIEIGGWTYPLHTQLLGCIYLIQHDPAIYPQPHQFQPERFLSTPTSSHYWLPWGGGRKRCPGLHLATLEMKTILGTVLEHTTVRPADRRVERPRWRSVIVTPERGSRVVLTGRKRDRRARPPAAAQNN